MKFKIKRNSTYNSGKPKPNSPDIRRRKSFRKYLKGSPEIQRSHRFPKNDLEDYSIDDGILSLKPTVVSKEESSPEQHQRVPILMTEDGLIQEQEEFPKRTRARRVGKVSLRIYGS